ncbi:prenyltransferase/squalene oxidase repeat-containing protein [Streptomyces sp. NPDC057137]|uniref:prenyltransferase/squalene oxidase repeat-containing protein n=1 Tax=Streptomyces sp. NPDC057137 TaxID=3346030 RepID=UPI00363A2C98
MGARLLSLPAALLLTIGLGTALVTTAAPAAADPIGDCTATTGAVVAVDFGDWGGDVVRGCDTTLTTGMELLHDGGFTTTGTVHDGPGFICRIGHDSFKGGAQHPTPADEACRLTPPADAYWSYWLAPVGQDHWTYSPLGALSQRPKPGEVQAWVFGPTDIGGSTGQPSFTPAEIRPGGGGDPDPGESTPPPVEPGTVDTEAAAGWLTGRLKDGDHIFDEGAEGPNHLQTAETAFALAAANGRGATLDKIKAYLTAHTAEFAYPQGTDKAPDPKAAARLALLAEISEGDPRDVGGHDLLGDLAANICANGPESGSAPGCSAKGDFTEAGSTDAQALAVLALLRGDMEPPAGTVSRLAALQCVNGAVTSVLIRPGEFCEGDAGTTALVALVLERAGGHGDAVAKARDFLKKSQRDDGSYVAYVGSAVGDVAMTATASQALRALGDTTRADAAMSWVSRQQNKDGGFGFEEATADSFLYPTVHATIGGAGTNLVTLTTKPTGPTDPPTGPPTDPPTGPPTDPPTGPPGDGVGPDLKKGTAYLTAPARLKQGHYYENLAGSGFADFGLTIDGAFALAATGQDNNALRGIVDFLDDRGKDGSTPGRTVDDWTGAGTTHAAGGSMGKAALLAEVVGRDPRDFAGQDLVAGLGEAVCAAPSQAPDRRCAAKGAYAYAPSVFSQTLGIMAQLRAGEKDAAAGPIAYLADLQHDSGAWPSLVPPTGDSEVDSTAMGAMALDLVNDDKAAAAVDKALAWIAREQLADGGFPGASGNSVNSAALAVQGLSLDAAKYGTEITKARKFLAAQQNKDGGFDVAADGQPGSDVRASTQALSGAVGTSFGTLVRDLSGTTPQPPAGPGATPPIVTPGDSGGSGGSGGSASGGLASTGVQPWALTLTALLLALAGWHTVAVARSRRTAAGGHR